MLAGLLFVSAGLCRGQDAAAGSIVRRVDERYNRLRSLRTRYVEHYTGMGMDRSEAGTLLLTKPGRMRWTYDTPVGKVFVMNGSYGWSYTPGDAQVQRLSAKKMDDLKSPLRFLLGHARLEKELAGISVTMLGNGFRIAGAPLGMGGRVQRLTLDVDAGGAIRGMRVEEAGGATTEFSFTKMQENVRVGAGDFIFEVPAGANVVEALPPV